MLEQEGVSIPVKQTTVYCASPGGYASPAYVDQYFGNLLKSCKDGCLSSHDCSKDEICDKSSFTCKTMPVCDVEEIIEAQWEFQYNDLTVQQIGNKIDISCHNSTKARTETVICASGSRWLRLDGSQLPPCSEKKCSQDADCYDQLCSQAKGVCVDCEEDHHCIQTTYESAHCQNDNCYDKCINNKCVLMTLNTTCQSCMECPKDKPNCINNQCSRCLVSADCEEGMVCLSSMGLCLECLTSSDCPDNYLCTMDHECKPRGGQCQECRGMTRS